MKIINKHFTLKTNYGEKTVHTRLPSNLRPTTRECVHLVRVVTSSHVTQMAVTVTPFDPPYPKTRAASKLRGCVCYRSAVIAEVLHFCGMQ